MKLIILFSFISINALAFTLTQANPPRYSEPDNVVIRISDADCDETGDSSDKLKSLTEVAIEDYWNNSIRH